MLPRNEPHGFLPPWANHSWAWSRSQARTLRRKSRRARNRSLGSCNVCCGLPASAPGGGGGRGAGGGAGGGVRGWLRWVAKGNAPDAWYVCAEFRIADERCGLRLAACAARVSVPFPKRFAQAVFERAGWSRDSAGMCHSWWRRQACCRVGARLPARISEAREREPRRRARSAWV